MSNISLAALKTAPPQPKQTLTQTNRILALSQARNPLSEADRVKALYRRGLAYVALKDDESAEKDFSEASKLSPGDKAVSTELAKLRKRAQELREKQKKAFGKMFA
jgi:peptidyl-prolyl isomerase D